MSYSFLRESGSPRSPIIVIPARLAATRLPNKPLADIHGEAMIVHVWRAAVAAGTGPVLVAAADLPIAEAIRSAGGRAVLTDPVHASGSDRIHEAVERCDPDRHHDAVINLQGDLPTIAPAAVRAVLRPLDDPAVDIATLVAPVTSVGERDDPNVVKAVLEIADGARVGRALYFSRAVVPSGVGPHHHHIGLYAFRRAALARFVAGSQGMLERRERLEQLRALAMGMRIDAAVIDDVPLGVDTLSDLELVREHLSQATRGRSPAPG